MGGEGVHVQPAFELFTSDPTYDDVVSRGFVLHNPTAGTFGKVQVETVDILWCLAWAVFLYFFRLVLARFVFLPTARKLVPSGKKRFLAKMEENAWYALYYTASTVFGVYAMWGKPFFHNPFFYWTDFPTVDHRDAAFSTYYYVGLGFYAQSLVALIAFETKRKDFFVMVIHHVVTVLLMAVSWSTGNDRIGGVVLLLHDAVDIFLYSCKVAHYCGKKAETLTNVIFATFAFVYAVLRLWFFLTRVIVPAVFAPAYSLAATYVFGSFDAGGLGVFVSEAGMCVGGKCMSPHFFLTGLLCVLLTLHFYWYALILRMLHRALVVKTVEQDVRSDSEDEDYDEDEDDADVDSKKKK